MLSCPLKKNRAERVDDRVDNKRKQSARDERDKEVGHAKEGADKWENKATAEDRHSIGGDQSDETYPLASDRHCASRAATSKRMRMRANDKKIVCQSADPVVMMSS